VIAVDAALRSLLDGGVVPEVVVTVESRRDALLPFFDGDLAALAGSALVYAPVVPAEVLARWPGRRLCAYVDSLRSAELARELPRAELYCSGSVIHPAVDLAVRSGAREVVLLGADFCFAHGRTHAAGSAYARAAPATATWVTDGRGERVPTLPNLRGYLRDLERYVARTDGVRFASASRFSARMAGVELLDGIRRAG